MYKYFRIADFTETSPKKLTRFSIFHLSRCKVKSIFIIHINLKNLRVCHESSLKNEKYMHSDAYTEVIIQGLLSLLFPWGINNEADKIMSKLCKSSHISYDSHPFGISLMVRCPGSLYVSQTHVMSTKSLIEGNSPSKSSIRLLALLIILKVLESGDNTDSSISFLTSYLTVDIYSHLTREHLQVMLPSLSIIAKYFNDPFPLFQLSCRTLFSTTLDHMSIKSLQDLFDEWYSALPSVQESSRKSMAKACVLLAAIVLHEQKKEKSNQPVVLGLSNALAEDSTERPQVTLTPQSEQQLVLSMISLLISNLKGNFECLSGPKNCIIHNCIAVEFLGTLWPHWEYILTNLS
jgi:hypothetical protein